MSGQPKTAEISAVPQWAADLIVSVKSGFTSVNERLDGLEGTDKTLADEVGRIGRDVNELRNADRRHEDDIRRLSDRTKESSATASSADLAHESRLAQEIVARQELAAKLDALTSTQETQLAILSRLDKFAANPNIKIILAVLATALMSWAASKGLNAK
jgi:hypothetical protein